MEEGDSVPEEYFCEAAAGISAINEMSGVMMHKGSCLCGAVSFELKSNPKATTHCHCKMCQKQHGAAFATYASVLESDLKYTSGQEKLAAYKSSKSITRKFCSVCGSNIEWSGSEEYPDWVSIAVASLDTEFNPGNIREVHLESRACWLATKSYR
jgi:hypothetical protein